MDRYAYDVSMTPEARGLLREGECLVIDWVRVSFCCAGAGEATLYPSPEKSASRRRGLVRIKGEDPIYAARAIFPHLAGRRVVIDGRRTLGLRRFITDLPGDFGLRAAFGRLETEGRQ